MTITFLSHHIKSKYDFMQNRINKFGFIVTRTRTRINTNVKKIWWCCLNTIRQYIRPKGHIMGLKLNEINALP